LAKVAALEGGVNEIKAIKEIRTSDITQKRNDNKVFLDIQITSFIFTLIAISEIFEDIVLENIFRIRTPPYVAYRFVPGFIKRGFF
jgi:hypothetical protein